MRAPPAGRLDIWWTSLAATPAGRGSAQSRAALGSILRHYLRDPVIDTDTNGKPFLVGVKGLSFNLSHSEKHLVVAVGDGAPVGVDCEAVRRFDDLMDVARMTCSAVELDLLHRADDASAVGIFHTLWTRKEAVVKAIGVGVSFPLSELTVATGSGHALSSIDAPGHGRWWLRSIDAPEGFAGACACRRPFEVFPRHDP
jgi:4'-phosphopantetheinyl transferase